MAWWLRLLIGNRAELVYIKQNNIAGGNPADTKNVALRISVDRSYRRCDPSGSRP
jgi:hypothetical protein